MEETGDCMARALSEEGGCSRSAPSCFAMWGSSPVLLWLLILQGQPEIWIFNVRCPHFKCSPSGHLDF